MTATKTEQVERVCDIILVASDPYLYVIDTIDSLSRTIRDIPVNLIIVSNGTEPPDTKQLETRSTYYRRVEIIKAKKPLPYIDAAIFGSTRGSADFFVTAPMGSLFPSGWLNQLLAIVETNGDTAAVTVLTNCNALGFSPALVPGTTVYEFSRLVSSASSKLLPKGSLLEPIPTIYRRSALRAIGLPKASNRTDLPSYLQERLISSGYRITLADNVYIHIRGIDESQTAGWMTATDEEKRAIREIKRGLTKKTGRIGLPTFNILEHTVRAFIRGVIRPFRSLRAGEIISRTSEVVSMLFPRRTPRLEFSSLSGLDRSPTLNITYVLDRMILSGGALVVVEIVNELAMLGVNARIATLGRYPETGRWECLSEPLVFRDADELITCLPDTDIAVATFWKTASWVHRLAANRPGLLPVYYLQDYEAWFYPESDMETRRKVIESYESIETKIATTGWLAKRLSDHGHDSIVIPIGVDTDAFHPRKKPFSDKAIVLAMARPSTPHRGFDTVIKTMSQVIDRIPGTRIILFGEDNLENMDIHFPFTNMGVVQDRKQMALLFAEADIFFDGSYFQGFGRPALEAMASGVSCVLTSAGGVTEYARDNKNVLLVPPRDPDRAADAICDLLTNKSKRERIAKAGRNTALCYSNRRIAQKTLDYFLTISKRKS